MTDFGRGHVPYFSCDRLDCRNRLRCSGCRDGALEVHSRLQVMNAELLTINVIRALSGAFASCRIEPSSICTNRSFPDTDCTVPRSTDTVFLAFPCVGR